MKVFDYLEFFVIFAGGSFLTLMLVTEYPTTGSLVIGLIMAILSLKYKKDAEDNTNEKGCGKNRKRIGNSLIACGRRYDGKLYLCEECVKRGNQVKKKEVKNK